MFIIYPDCLVTFTLTYMYILYYLNYLAPMRIDSVLVLLVYSLVIVIVLLFRKYFLTFLTLHCWEWARHKASHSCFCVCDQYD